MYSRRKSRHLKGMTDASSASMSIPDVTGDATARYENNTYSGTTWYDLMPTPANGTGTGFGAGVDWPRFDGAQFVTVGQPAKLDFSTGFSLVAWGSQDPGVSGYERLISRDNNAGLRTVIFSQHDNTGNPFIGAHIGGGLKTVVGPGTYAASQWHFYVATWDGANLSLYVDGALEGSAAAAGALANNAIDWEFGRAQNST